MTRAPADFAAAFARCPLVAILRGLTPGEVDAVGEAWSRSRLLDHRSAVEFAAAL